MTPPLDTAARMRRVRILTTALIALTFVFGVYWTIHILSWVLSIGLTDRVYDLPFVDDDSTFSTQQRLAFLGIWAAIIGVVWKTIYDAMRLLLALRAGAFFEIGTTVQIQRVGLSLTLIAVLDTILTSVQNSILTWNNASETYIAPRYYFDGADITLLLCGLVFFVVGWVLYEGVQIDAENKGFI